MAPVMYWINCKDCGYEDYVRYRLKECSKCGSENVNSILEWDEENDHHE